MLIGLEINMMVSIGRNPDPDFDFELLGQKKHFTR